MADYLSEEEQLDRLKSWWRDNGTSIVVAAVLAIGGVAGWRWYDSARVEEMQAASEAYEAYMAAQDDARESLAAQLAADFGETSYAVFSQLRQANELAEADDLQAAVASLRRIVAQGAHPLLEDIARMRLARLLRQEGDGDAALEVLARVRSDGFRGQVLELKGDMHLSRGERALAHEAYVAAVAEMSEGDQRPILQFKVEDTTPPAETP